MGGGGTVAYFQKSFTQDLLSVVIIIWKLSMLRF